VTDIVTVGWFTIDDIVLPDRSCRFGVAGGGALYSAVGAQIWAPKVGIHAVAGQPSIDALRMAIADRGIDVEGITPIDGNGLLLWLLHESADSKQQVPKLMSSSADGLDQARPPLPAAYKGARGFHVAPQSPAGGLENAARLGQLSHHPIVTMDLLSDTFIDRRPYLDLNFLAHLTAFLPSEAEIERIWNPPELSAWLTATAAARRCHMIAKLGAGGSLVCDAGTGELYRVPVVAVQVVDTTGAGDAYCGGFLAGLVAGRPVVECAAMGTVSASYVVGVSGALATARPDASERNKRLAGILRQVERLPR
jgi:sugar/nucleoside kinase (ribokinase family)